MRAEQLIKYFDPLQREVKVILWKTDLNSQYVILLTVLRWYFCSVSFVFFFFVVFLFLFFFVFFCFVFFLFFFCFFFFFFFLFFTQLTMCSL